MEELVAYKLHVGGFTRDASSGVAEAARGTFQGVADKVQHLVDMGEPASGGDVSSDASWGQCRSPAVIVVTCKSRAAVECGIPAPPL